MGWRWRRKTRERDLDRELESHLELEAEEQIASGAPPDAALNVARRAFGNVGLVKEDARAAWGWTTVETLALDLRYAVRVLRKNPGFSLIAVLALALGIGGNTVVFSALNAVMLRPLPFPHPDELVRIWESYGKPNVLTAVSYPNFADWRSWNRTFSGMAAFSGADFVLTGAGEPTHIEGVLASASLFDVLGVRPILGRRFRTEEDQPGALGGTNAIILSNALWRNRFGADPSMVGRVLTLDGATFTVVGVMPPGFDSRTEGSGADFWITAAMLAERRPGATRPVSEERTMSFLGVIGWLKPGVSVRQAQADMNRIGAELQRAYPDIGSEGANMKNLQEAEAGNVRPTILLLLGATGVVFLIACADVSGLVMARAAGRQREMTIRAAIGAGRWRLVRQLSVESLVLALAGCGVGLGFARLAGKLLGATLRLSSSEQPELDIRVLGFAAATALIAALVFSLAPALHAAKTDLMRALRESGTAAGENLRQRRLRSALVAGQITLAMVLLSSAALLALSLIRLQRVPIGFEPHDALTFPVSLPQASYGQMQRAQFFRELTNRLQELPGVISVGAGGQLPLRGGVARTALANVMGREIPLSRRTGIGFSSVTPGYFRTLGIPIRKGREFTQRDTRESATVVIINVAAARQYFPEHDPIGQQVTPGMWNGSGSTTQPRTIVGVVADVKLESVAERPIPVIYWPVTQVPSDGTLHVVVRTSGDPLRSVSAVRGALHTMDKELPLYNVQPLDHYLSRALEQSRNTASLVTLFAMLALTLTGVGLYGVIAYSVARRTREIGLRMALGAGRREVLRGFVLHGLAMAAIGVAIGLPAAIGTARLFRSMLYGVSPQEPVTLGIAAAVLIVVALAASFIPARRATRVDPMVALRYE